VNGEAAPGTPSVLSVDQPQARPMSPSGQVVNDASADELDALVSDCRGAVESGTGDFDSRRLEFAPGSQDAETVSQWAEYWASFLGDSDSIERCRTVGKLEQLASLARCCEWSSRWRNACQSRQWEVAAHVQEEAARWEAQRTDESEPWWLGGALDPCVAHERDIARWVLSERALCAEWAQYLLQCLRNESPVPLPPREDAWEDCSRRFQALKRAADLFPLCHRGSAEALEFVQVLRSALQEGPLVDLAEASFGEDVKESAGVSLPESDDDRESEASVPSMGANDSDSEHDGALMAPPSVEHDGAPTAPPSVEHDGALTAPPSAEHDGALTAPPSAEHDGAPTAPPSVEHDGAPTAPPSVEHDGAPTAPPDMSASDFAAAMSPNATSEPTLASAAASHDLKFADVPLEDLRELAQKVASYFAMPPRGIEGRAGVILGAFGSFQLSLSPAPPEMLDSAPLDLEGLDSVLEGVSELSSSNWAALVSAMVITLTDRETLERVRLERDLAAALDPCGKVTPAVASLRAALIELERAEERRPSRAAVLSIILAAWIRAIRACVMWTDPNRMEQLVAAHPEAVPPALQVVAKCRASESLGDVIAACPGLWEEIQLAELCATALRLSPLLAHIASSPPQWLVPADYPEDTTSLEQIQQIEELCKLLSDEEDGLSVSVRDSIQALSSLASALLTYRVLPASEMVLDAIEGSPIPLSWRKAVLARWKSFRRFEALLAGDGDANECEQLLATLDQVLLSAEERRSQRAALTLLRELSGMALALQEKRWTDALKLAEMARAAGLVLSKLHPPADTVQMMSLAKGKIAQCLWDVRWKMLVYSANELVTLGSVKDQGAPHKVDTVGGRIDLIMRQQAECEFWEGGAELPWVAGQEWLELQRCAAAAVRLLHAAETRSWSAMEPVWHDVVPYLACALSRVRGALDTLSLADPALTREMEQVLSACHLAHEGSMTDSPPFPVRAIDKADSETLIAFVRSCSSLIALCDRLARQVRRREMAPRALALAQAAVDRALPLSGDTVDWGGFAWLAREFGSEQDSTKEELSAVISTTVDSGIAPSRTEAAQWVREAFDQTIGRFRAVRPAKALADPVVERYWLVVFQSRIPSGRDESSLAELEPSLDLTADAAVVEEERLERELGLVSTEALEGMEFRESDRASVVSAPPAVPKPSKPTVQDRTEEQLQASHHGLGRSLLRELGRQAALSSLLSEAVRSRDTEQIASVLRSCLQGGIRPHLIARYAEAVHVLHRFADLVTHGREALDTLNQQAARRVASEATVEAIKLPPAVESALRHLAGLGHTALGVLQRNRGVAIADWDVHDISPAQLLAIRSTQVDETRYSIRLWPRLKRGEELSRAVDIADASQSLVFSFKPLRSSLTILPAEESTLAAQASRSILGYARCIQTSFDPEALGAAVVQLASGCSPGLRDELFLQLCRLTRRCSHALELRRVWTLLHALCRTARPSLETLPFVEAHLFSHSRQWPLLALYQRIVTRDPANVLEGLARGSVDELTEPPPSAHPLDEIHAMELLSTVQEEEQNAGWGVPWLVVGAQRKESYWLPTHKPVHSSALPASAPETATPPERTLPFLEWVLSGCVGSRQVEPPSSPPRPEPPLPLEDAPPVELGYSARFEQRRTHRPGGSVPPSETFEAASAVSDTSWGVSMLPVEDSLHHAEEPVSPARHKRSQLLAGMRGGMLSPLSGVSAADRARLLVQEPHIRTSGDLLALSLPEDESALVLDLA
jgi:hypothetical protein